MRSVWAGWKKVCVPGVAAAPDLEAPPPCISKKGVRRFLPPSDTRLTMGRRSTTSRTPVLIPSASWLCSRLTARGSSSVARSVIPHASFDLILTPDCSAPGPRSSIPASLDSSRLERLSKRLRGGRFTRRLVSRLETSTTTRPSRGLTPRGDSPRAQSSAHTDILSTVS